MSDNRRLQIQRQTTGMTLGQMTLTELHGELMRRIERLQEERSELVERIGVIDNELAAIPVIKPGPPVPEAPKPGSRRTSRAAVTRRVNERPLREVLLTVLDGNTLTTREAAEAAIAQGYKTSSRNFPNTVYVALHKDARFVKAPDGKWAVTSETR